MPDKPLRSLADLPRDKFTPPAPQWVEWEPRDLKKEMLNMATVTLRTWLDARCADLIRDRVSRDRIVVRAHGNRTVIYVDGNPRFEFKLKLFMEER